MNFLPETDPVGRFESQDSKSFGPAFYRAYHVFVESLESYPTEGVQGDRAEAQSAVSEPSVRAETHP